MTVFDAIDYANDMLARARQFPTRTNLQKRAKILSQVLQINPEAGPIVRATAALAHHVGKAERAQSKRAASRRTKAYKTLHDRVTALERAVAELRARPAR